MLNERKLTERELDQRKSTLKGLLSNKRALVQKYGKDAEKVMYGVATKQAKNKVESMDKEKIKEYIKQALLKKEGFVDTAPVGEPESGQEVDVDTGFSGRADYGAEDKYLGGEDEEEVAAANAPVVPSGQTFLPGVPTPKMEEEDLNEAERAADKFNVNVFGYQTKYYKVCPGAKAFMDKVMSGDYGDMSNIKNETIRLAKLHDVLFKMEIQALKDPNYAANILDQAEYVVKTIRDQVDMMNRLDNKSIPMDAVNYLDNHIEIIKDEAKKVNENINEGHGLDQDDLDYLKDRVQPGGPIRGRLKKIIDFIIKSNILQDKTKDLSVKEEKEMSDEEREDKLQQAKRGGGKEKPLRKLAKMGKDKVNENIEDYEVDDAVMELRNIVDEIDQKADEARDIVRDIFPNELSRLDAYGAFNAMYSANRYDTTLGKFVDRLEEEGYEIEDGVAYVNEGHMMSMDDLDVGHTDNEPHMLKKELARAGQMIQMLYRAVDKYDGQGEVDFPQWWQKKIIQANAMLDSAFDYIDGEEMVAKIDAMIDNMDKVEIDIDVVDEDVSSANFAKGIEVVKDTLSKEGGAAGLEPLVKELVKLGFKKSEVVDLLKNMTSVKKHRDGDYILLPLEEKVLNEAMDGGRLFDYFNKKYIVDDHFHSDDSYIVKREPSGKDQYVIFDYDKDKDQFQIRQLGGYRIDQEEAIKAGMKETSRLARAGMDAYMVDGNYSPTPISIKGLKDVVDHVMGGLSREAAAQQDYYARRGPTSGTIDEKISSLVREKLTKKSKVDDFVDDFTKSDAKQFKGKSKKKKKEMAVAAYLAKQKA